MKSFRSVLKLVLHWLYLTVLWLLFLSGLAAGLGSGVVLDGGQAQAAKYGGIALSMVAGTLLAREEPLKSFLSSRPVLWFLFLFNGAVAAGVYFLVGGATGIGACVGMGLVSLGAGGGLLQNRKRRRASIAGQVVS